MKKNLLLLTALAWILGLVSCSSDESLADKSAGKAAVTVRAKLPSEFLTRAISDGLTATRLTYAVYESGTKNIVYQKTVVDNAFSNREATLDLRLAIGKTYDFIFWADSQTGSPYTFDDVTQTITVDYANATSNDENRDAFFGQIKGSHITAATTSLEATLTRPFAQINVATDDMGTAGASVSKSAFTIEGGVYSTLNLLDGTVSDAVTTPIAFSATAIPTEQITIDGKQYTWLSMDYVLASADKEVTKVTATWDGATVPALHFPLDNVPLRRNYRTNIYGSLLTSAASVKIKIDQDYLKPDYNLCQTITTPSDLTAAKASGGTYRIEGTAIQALDLTNITPKQPLTLRIATELTSLNLGTTSADPAQPITIEVEKDVKYPATINLNALNDAPSSLTSGVKIQNITLKGDPTTTEPCKSFNIKGGYNTLDLIDGLTIEGVKFDGPNVNLNFAAIEMKNITVRECVFDNLTAPGINLQNHGNYPGNQRYNNCKIGDITVEGCTFNFASSATKINGVYLTEVEGNVTVKNCTVNGAKYHGIYVRGDNAITITGNTITAACDGIKVESNTPANNAGVQSLSAHGQGTVLIENNDINGTENGIRVAPRSIGQGCTITIAHNTITAPTASGEDGNGILLTNKYATGGVALTAPLTIKGNVKKGTIADETKWITFTGFTPAAGSVVNTPWNN